MDSNQQRIHRLLGGTQTLQRCQWASQRFLSTNLCFLENASENSWNIADIIRKFHLYPRKSVEWRIQIGYHGLHFDGHTQICFQVIILVYRIHKGNFLFELDFLNCLLSETSPMNFAMKTSNHFLWLDYCLWMTLLNGNKNFCTFKYVSYAVPFHMPWLLIIILPPYTAFSLCYFLRKVVFSGYILLSEHGLP